MALSDYLIALCLTLVIEMGTAALMGYRTLLALRTVVLANLVTHPLLWYVIWAGESYGMPLSTTPFILYLEAVVVVIEWLLLLFVLQERPWKLLRLSFTMNAASYLAGVALYAL